jgi:hypothetical protein
MPRNNHENTLKTRYRCCEWLDGIVQQLEGAVINGFYRKGVVFIAAWAVVACAAAVRAQEPAASTAQKEDRPTNTQTDERQTSGTVTSVGRGSIVVRTDEGRFVVFAVNRSLVGTAPLEPGTRVTVTTAIDDDDPAQTALAVDRLPARQGLAAQAQTSDPVPATVRRLSADIERQARKYRAGVSAGAALDPELISVDAFATLVPWRQQRLAVRPGVELAFGEVTTLLGLHFDVLYSVPGVRPSARWAPYVGAGPNFSFSHRGIDEDEFLEGGVTEPDDNDRFDFSQYDWNNGFNFIVGARTPRGAFFELKATAYGVANIRMLAGFEF